MPTATTTEDNIWQGAHIQTENKTKQKTGKLLQNETDLRLLPIYTFASASTFAGIPKENPSQIPQVMCRRTSKKKIEYAHVLTHLTLISTWLKVLPLYTPTMDPTISGRMTMSLRWVFTTSGFSMGGASFFALRRRFRRDCCLRRRPRFSLLLWRAQYSCISCSLRREDSDVSKGTGRRCGGECKMRTSSAVTLSDFDTSQLILTPLTFWPLNLHMFCSRWSRNKVIRNTGTVAQSLIVCHLLGHVQKLVQVHTSVGELPEGTLLLDLGIRLRETNHPASVWGMTLVQLTIFPVSCKHSELNFIGKHLQT